MAPPNRILLLLAACASSGCAGVGEAPVATSVPAPRDQQVVASRDQEAPAPGDHEVAALHEQEVGAPRDQVSPPLKPPDIPDALGERLSKEIAVSEEREQRIAERQEQVYDLVQGTATRIDSFFGTSEGDTQATVSRGRLSLGGQYDAFNGFEPRVRFTARITLPA